MEYRVLGTLEVLRDGQVVDLGAFRQRALLALLLTEPNSVFSSDQIIDRLWGPDGGMDRQNALWVYVSGLRKALEPDRERRSEGSILLTRSPGYLVKAAPEEIDSVRFEQLVAEGRALVDVDPAAASLVLAEALALWRGRAFEDFTYESFIQTEIARLEELRLEAVEVRIDADLRRGNVTRADLRARDARPPASVERTLHRAMDARPAPVGTAGRRAPRLPAPQGAVG